MKHWKVVLFGVVCFCVITGLLTFGNFNVGYQPNTVTAQTITTEKNYFGMSCQNLRDEINENLRQSHLYMDGQIIHASLAQVYELRAMNLLTIMQLKGCVENTV